MIKTELLSEDPFVSKLSGVFFDTNQKWIDLILEQASYDQNKASIRRDRAYCKLFQPTFRFKDRNDPMHSVLFPLLGLINRNVRFMLTELGMPSTTDIGVDRDAWGLVYEDGESCGPHGHGRENLYAGVYYLETTEGSGEIYFPEAGLEVEPKSGDLLLFGSPVIHGVMANTIPDSTRICVAFNVRDFSKK